MRFPNSQQRISILGATGSGKTVAALFHLSRQNFTDVPWIVYDFKGDENINSIERAQPLDLSAPLPEYPGIYIVHALPDEESEVSNHMMGIWKRGDIGVYVDEGFMVGRSNKGYRSLLTQGRSLHVPMIVLSQRPAWIDRFTFSESDFFQIYRLTDKDDIKKVNRFVPYDLTTRLDEYHSFYYDVGKNQIAILSPVPEPETILHNIDLRLRTLKQVI